MMASKRLSIEEQIEKKEESIKQLQNQKRQLKKKLNEQERKARNKRLIEKGAVFESIFEESIDLTKDEFYKLIKTLNDEEIRLNIMEILEERIDDNVLTYSEIQKEKSKYLKGYAKTNKEKYDFKKLTSAYSYLRKNNIETIGQLQTKIETLKSNSYRLNKKAKTIHKEMEDVEKKILYYEIYKAKKEVYEEYQKKNIFTKEAFYNKHKKDIDQYKVVSGKLKKLLSDKEKLSPKKWNEEKILLMSNLEEINKEKFASMMQEKINMKVDTSEIEKEIDNYQKELRKSHSTKFKLIEEIDNLDVEDKHYKRRKQDLDDRLYRMYDKIDELESSLIDAKAKKQTIEAEKLTGDNIYKVLIYFDKLYKVMNDVERRQLISALISEIQVYEEKQSNGQWLKSITFKLPIIEENLNIDLDNDEQVECVSLLEKRS